MSIDEGLNWTQIGVYPLGLFDWASVMEADMNKFGRLYVGFGGNGFIYHDLTAGTEVSLKVLLEGAYKEELGEMAADLGSLVPLSQPYNQAPYNYLGTETIPTVTADIVDWVLVEAREGVPNLSGSRATITIETKAGLLLKDGSIVSPSGGVLGFENLSEGQAYYFCVRHRNHLDVFTTSPTIIGDFNEYDFTTNVGQAIGILQQKQSNDGKALMYAGDYNQDGLIQTTDYDQWISNPAQLDVYQTPDGNIDGLIQTTDYDVWFGNKAKIGTPEIGY